jgi:organic hydroperoxide reductase OsmC/OhrA
MIPDSSTFRCTIRWQGANNTDYETFGRTHEVTLPAGQSIIGGAAHNIQHPEQTNPEELFAAAVGTCMMMTILAVFSIAKIPVLAYEDQVEALLEKVERRWWVAKVILRPRISLGGHYEREKLDNLIAKSHANCFVSLSVKSEIVVEPTFEERMKVEG